LASLLITTSVVSARSRSIVVVPEKLVVDPPAAVGASTNVEPAGPIAQAEATIESSASWILPALALTGALWWAQAVFIPIVVSVLISYALEPIVKRLESWHVRRAVAVPIIMCSLIAGASGTAYALRSEAVAFLDHLPSAAHTIAEAVRGSTRGAPGGTVARVQEAARELETAASSATKKKDAHDGVTPVRIEEPTFRWSNWFWQGSYGALEFAGQMVAVLFLVYYMLAAGDLYKRKMVHIVPTLTNKKITVQILAEIDRQIERFLLARVAISAIVGVAIWLSFRLFGLEEAGVWGVLAAVVFAIPIVGPTVVVIAAALAAFVQFGSIGMALTVFAAGAAIGFVEGYVLTPWLMSRVGEMNAIAVFVSLLFWGWIWGVWGLLLAVPMTAAMKAVCERIPDFNAFAELLKE
jgi:predicted PurR-regulated permease PerM